MRKIAGLAAAACIVAAGCASHPAPRAPAHQPSVRAQTHLVLLDQVSDAVIPFSWFQAAAYAWGGQVGVAYGGPAGCESDPDVICQTAVFPADWLGETVRNLNGVFLVPGLQNQGALVGAEVIAHEMGNALGYPELPCGTASVQSNCVDSASLSAFEALL